MSLRYWACSACVPEPPLLSTEHVMCVFWLPPCTISSSNFCLHLDVSGIIGRETCPPPWAFENTWTPPSSSLLFLTSFFNQTGFSIHFRSNKAGDLCPAWMDPWWEPPSPGIVLLATPSNWHSPHSLLCPSAIHSDFVQLVNLASSPCWELRRRKGRRRGNQEEKVEKGGDKNLYSFYVL